RKVAAFSRETICFSKKASRMMDKYLLYICYKNYMKPQFVKAHRNDPDTLTKSPAMRLAITDRLLSFGDFFGFRHPSPDLDTLPLDWKHLYLDQVAFTRSLKHASKTPFPAHN